MAIPAIYNHPASQALMEIDQQKRTEFAANDELLRLCPIVNHDAASVSWEILDDFVGLQQVRGLDGSYPRVTKTGSGRYTMIPGPFGEREDVSEREIVELRKLGTFEDPEVMGSLLERIQTKLRQRYLDRIRQLVGRMLIDGRIEVSGSSGQTEFVAAYAQEGLFTALTLWSDYANSTPLGDLMTVQELARGQGAAFDNRAVALMNRVTVNHLLRNRNANDLGGEFNKVVQAERSVTTANRVLEAAGLPTIVVYDEGWQTAHAGTHNPFIPDGRVLIAGFRNGEGNKVGEYQLVRNAENPNQEPGMFVGVFQNPLPPRIWGVYCSHNGGPAIMRPRSLRVMRVL